AINDILKALAPSFSDQVIHSQGVYDGFTALADDLRVTGNTEKRGGFRRLDQAVQQDLVDETVAIALAAATDMTNARSRVHALLGGCASDTNSGNDADCVRAFIQKAGRLILRRTLDQDDIDFYYSVYGADGIDGAGLADVLIVMLTSPYFLYQVEH